MYNDEIKVGRKNHRLIKPWLKSIILYAGYN